MGVVWRSAGAFVLNLSLTAILLYLLNGFDHLPIPHIPMNPVTLAVMGIWGFAGLGLLMAVKLIVLS